MDFQLTHEQQLLQETARKFARTELMELARQVEESDEPPGIELRKRFADMGFLGDRCPMDVLQSDHDLVLFLLLLRRRSRSTSQGLLRGD